MKTLEKVVGVTLLVIISCLVGAYLGLLVVVYMIRNDIDYKMTGYVRNAINVKDEVTE